MNINIKATGIELTPAIEDYADKKILPLEKFLPKPTDAYIMRLELAKTTNHHKEGLIFRAEVQIAHGIDIYAAAEAEDLYAAIDQVADDTEREIKSKRGRRESVLRRGQRALKDAVRGVSNRFRRN